VLPAAWPRTARPRPRRPKKAEPCVPRSDVWVPSFWPSYSERVPSRRPYRLPRRSPDPLDSGRRSRVGLGATADSVVKTPVIDRLAAAGGEHASRHDRAGVFAEPLGVHDGNVRAHDCGPSPSHLADADKQPLPEGVRLLTHWFHDLGYRTGNIAEFPAAFGFKVAGKRTGISNFRRRPPSTRGAGPT
jgi:hypothetical protein